MNQINAIHPYYHSGLWVFDDKEKGLDKEPFVGGMPEIIDNFLKVYKIENAEKGFTILFSKDYFPDCDIILKLVEEEGGGNWYEVAGMRGWLCPALFKYFDKAPEKIYVKLKSLQNKK